MKRIRGIIIKGWLTSIFGVITMLITLLMLFVGQISFVWEGIAGLCLGSILLMAPMTIEKALLEAIKAWGNKGNDGGYYNYNPPTKKDDDEPSIKDEPK